MTDKEIVLAKYPDAYARYYQSIYQWYIRLHDLQIIGTGNTEAEAWADAARRIKEAP